MFRHLIRWPTNANFTRSNGAFRSCATSAHSTSATPDRNEQTAQPDESNNARIARLSASDAGRSVRIQGWIRQRRHMKSRTFVDINDGSGPQTLQILIDKQTNLPAGRESLAFGASVRADGQLARAPSGQLELHARAVRLLGDCPPSSQPAGFPFVAGQQHPPEYARDHLHLRARLAPMAAALRVRSHAAQALAAELQRQHFCQVHTPVLTGNDCEGGGETFTVRPASDELLRNMRKSNVPLDRAYFDGRACLSVSAQLHLEAMCHGLGNVYAFGPVFRAENSRTPIHLAEFHMLEAEQAFAERIEELCTTMETLLKNATRSLLDGPAAEDLALIGRTAKQAPDYAWLERPVPIVRYAEALRVLDADGLLRPTTDRDGLSKEQELHLVDRFGGPVFVVEWPAHQKPFYMRPQTGNERFVDAVDLLVPGVGELCGGSLREDCHEQLVARLPADSGLEWYAELRRYGGIRTGGFGMGFERYLQWLMGMPNIKDVIAFPRWAHNCPM